MGILNVTPDSFSGDGLGAGQGRIGRVVDRAADFIAAGADILDIGGESTRPGASPVSAEEELERVVPAVLALSDRFPETVRCAMRASRSSITFCAGRARSG
jgi:dihydropteroate synthase